MYQRRSALERAVGRFFRFYDRQNRPKVAEIAASCQKFRKGAAFGGHQPKHRLSGMTYRKAASSLSGSCPPETGKCHGPAPEKPLRFPPSTTPSMPCSTPRAPSPCRAASPDRPAARLRAAIADNEARFEQAISADFGHRAAIETTIAETHVRALRDQARDQASEEMDGAAARRAPRCNSCPARTG